MSDIKVEKVGLKDDKGKLRFDLITPGCLTGLAEVLTYGAHKYKPNSWQNVEDAENKHYAALLRHLVAWRSGEVYDSETNLSHIKHILTNAMFLLYQEERNDKREHK